MHVHSIQMKSHHICSTLYKSMIPTYQQNNFISFGVTDKEEYGDVILGYHFHQ